MEKTMPDLNIAEIFYESGEIQYRYTRYLSEDSSCWVRHGLFKAYHPNGNVASPGHYQDGAEHGAWRDLHANVGKAAQGNYDQGNEVRVWKFWGEDGTPSDR
ncbi:hypothetical protein [Achromobacter sp.]|uniref:toxin-antitoxin system YwqK family antitoxin n=1 Tax=Achromobacter sp. TaxID=134375 RepID=UPI0028A2DC8E|nr:hypothetical protein [Achromobacter sp.]